MSTVTETDSIKDQYLADCERVAGGSAPQWLSDARAKGRQLLTERPLPHSKLEMWRFTDVRPLTRTFHKAQLVPSENPPSAETIAKFLYQDAGWHEAVFVDGFHEPNLEQAGTLPDGVTVAPLSRAIADSHPAVEAHLDKYAPEIGNAFTALNSAMLSDGVVVHVPKGVVAETPIHLCFVNTGAAEPAARHTRILIVLEDMAEATVLASYVHAGGGNYFANVVEEIAVGQNAHLHRYAYTEHSPEGHQLLTARAHLQRDASMNGYTITNGGAITRNEISVVLDGEGANVDLRGLYMTADGELVDNPLHIDHAKANCNSWIGYKGILDGKSQAVYTGKIDVRRDSQKTDSNQLNQNLLLSDKATIDTKPQLEIYADDVKCTHGATIGQHPEKVVYYFRTRGIDEAMARAMLTYGFADEVVQELDVDAFRERMETIVFDKYSPKPAADMA